MKHHFHKGVARSGAAPNIVPLLTQTLALFLVHHPEEPPKELLPPPPPEQPEQHLSSVSGGLKSLSWGEPMATS